MKTIRHILLLAVAAMTLACSKKEVIPDVPGVMSATVEMVAGDFDHTQYYKYKVKINRDPNVVGDNVITISKENAVGRGLCHVNGELYMNPVSSESNEFSIEYQPLTNDDKLKPFAFDVTVTAGNTQPVKFRISLDKPLVLENPTMYLGLDQTKLITAADGLGGASFTSTDNSIVTVDAQGRIKGIKPGKTTVGVKRDGVVATCAVQVVNYRPVNDFVLNVNGKDYHAATDTLFVKRGDVLKVKMVSLLPTNANSRNVFEFKAYNITHEFFGYQWRGTLKYDKNSIPFETFFTDQEYTVTCNQLEEYSEFWFGLKVFPELPENYYNYTPEQLDIRRACDAIGNNGNFYNIRLVVKEIE